MDSAKRMTKPIASNVSTAPKTGKGGVNSRASRRQRRAKARKSPTISPPISRLVEATLIAAPR